MKAGTVVIADENNCIIKTGSDDNNLGVDIYIKYFSIGVTVNVNNNVTQGQKIGEVSTGNKDDSNTFSIGVYGNQDCSDKLNDDVNLSDNSFKSKKIIDDCNLTKAKEYSGGSTYTYCGLVFASKFEKRIISGGSRLTGNPQDYFNACLSYAQSINSSEFTTHFGSSWENCNATNFIGMLAVVDGIMSWGSSGSSAVVPASTMFYENFVTCIRNEPTLTTSSSISDFHSNWGHCTTYGNDGMTYVAIIDGINGKFKSMIADPYLAPSGLFQEYEYRDYDRGGDVRIQTYMLDGILQRKCKTYGLGSGGNVEGKLICRDQGWDAYFQQYPGHFADAALIWENIFEVSEGYYRERVQQLCEILGHGLGFA